MDSAPHGHTGSRTRHLVRPRRVWGGTAVALVGCGILAVGGVSTSWMWALPGVVVLVVGATVAYRGGILYDARSGGLRPELSQTIHGQARQGTAPGDMVADPRAVASSRRVERRRRRLERAAASAPRRVPVRPTGALLVGVAVFLLVGQWELYPLELPGQSNATRALGCAIVVGFAGMRVLESGPGRAHTVSALAAVSAGALLVLNGLLADHDRSAVAASEVVCGVVSALCAGVLVVAAHTRRTTPSAGTPAR
jgi:hypothetical protein